MQVAEGWQKGRCTSLGVLLPRSSRDGIEMASLSSVRRQHNGPQPGDRERVTTTFNLPANFMKTECSSGLGLAYQGSERTSYGFLLLELHNNLIDATCSILE